MTKNQKEHANISRSFIENQTFLKKFVARFFSTSEDVEDVVQETYLRAYVAEGKRKISAHKSFLFSTAKNIALTKMNSKSAQLISSLEECSYQEQESQADPSADEVVDALQQLTLYLDAVETLDDNCKEAFLLRKAEGMSNKEIAARMAVSLSSVEKYLRRAMIACDEFILRANTEETATASVEEMRQPIESRRK